MVECPECGYSGERVTEWFEEVIFEDHTETYLVVCPGCDCVLGGGHARVSV